jgi:hypothetical protein
MRYVKNRWEVFFIVALCLLALLGDLYLITGGNIVSLDPVVLFFCGFYFLLALSLLYVLPVLTSMTRVIAASLALPFFLSYLLCFLLIGLSWLIEEPVSFNFMLGMPFVLYLLAGFTAIPSVFLAGLVFWLRPKCLGFPDKS